MYSFLSREKVNASWLIVCLKKGENELKCTFSISLRKTAHASGFMEGEVRRGGGGGGIMLYIASCYGRILTIALINKMQFLSFR